MAKVAISNDIVAAAEQAIEHYTKLVTSGKSHLVGGNSDKKGVPEKRKKMGIALGTFGQILSGKNNTLSVIPTGIKSIDDASGVGGIPKGKMVEIIGRESGGKSYIAYKTIASCQKMSGVAALLDLEQSFTKEWARTVGINPDALLGTNESMPMERYLQLAIDLCLDGYLDLLVIDSTAAMVPQSEFDGVIGQQEMAGMARVLSQSVKQVMMAAANTDGPGGKQTAVIWINQIREKPGVLFGNPETTTGGNALRFYCHQRIDVRKKGVERLKMGEDDVPVSQKSGGRYIKNKLATPYKKFEFDIKFESIFTNPFVMLSQLACERKVFKKWGGIYRLFEDGEKKIETTAKDFVDLAHWIHDESATVQVVQLVTESFLEKGETPPDFLAQIDDTTLPPLRVKNPDLIEPDGEAQGYGAVLESGDGDSSAESDESDAESFGRGDGENE